MVWHVVVAKQVGSLHLFNLHHCCCYHIPLHTQYGDRSIRSIVPCYTKCGVRMKYLILIFFATLVQTHKIDCCVIVAAISTMHN